MRALEPFHRAVVAFREGNVARALDACREAAAADPASRVFAEAARYLERVVRVGRAEVYVESEAFRAFIRSGGNVRLYEAASRALADTYRAHPGATLLDLGVGDGRALLPALTPDVASVLAVEPAAEMLEATAAALRARGVVFEAIGATAQELCRARPGGTGATLAQATFSLQAIPPDERGEVLAWLARHVERLLVIEFDVPCFEPPDGEDAVRHAALRYEAGLAEHAGDGGLVAQGFLMPVFFGYFDPTRARATYEQPIAAWREELARAGFGDISARELDAYWWASAQLLSSRSERLSRR